MDREDEAELTGAQARRRPRQQPLEVGGRRLAPATLMMGHGYDPIFQPDGHPVTLGEMPAKTKNSLSHRARAVSRMIEACFA